MQRGAPWKPRSLFSSHAASGEEWPWDPVPRVERGWALKIRLKESTAVAIASFDAGGFTAVTVKRA